MISFKFRSRLPKNSKSVNNLHTITNSTVISAPKRGRHLKSINHVRNIYALLITTFSRSVEILKVRLTQLESSKLHKLNRDQESRNNENIRETNLRSSNKSQPFKKGSPKSKATTKYYSMIG